MSNQQDLYRRLPQIGEVLQSEECLSLLQKHPRSLVTMVARDVLAGLRCDIQNSRVGADGIGADIDQRVANIGSEVAQATAARLKYQLQPVINATGVILQTNLGRAPLGDKVLQHVLEVAGGYCNLELDLRTGARGRRDDHAEGLLLDLLSAKLATDPGRMRRARAAAVVNNCAAATYLALNAVAEGGEVIVSRGELVEIGGGFRIPEILAKSGAVLREVGTTNRTRIEDYRAALSAGTRMILRVHRSNFRIEGFTEQPSLEQLIALGAQAGVPVFEDQGTGCLDDLAAIGLTNESSWLESVACGPALIASSGDKLLGGPQCGLLVGEREIIEKLRHNPLYRVLRVDKLTYAALEATLQAYLSGEEETLPVLAMIRLSAHEIQQRCMRWVAALQGTALEAEIVETQSVVGGGTTPGACLPSFGVAMAWRGHSEGELAAELRRMGPPVIARTSARRVVLDLRTVAPQHDAAVVTALQHWFADRDLNAKAAD